MPERGIGFAATGPAVDWVVVMRRFDQALLFDALAKAGRLRASLMRALTEEIAAFHAAAERRSGCGGAAALCAIAAENDRCLRAAGEASFARRASTRSARTPGSGSPPLNSSSGTIPGRSAGRGSMPAPGPRNASLPPGALSASCNPAHRRLSAASVTMKSIGMSKGCGWIVAIRDSSKPTPIASGFGASAASVRSK